MTPTSLDDDRAERVEGPGPDSGVDVVTGAFSYSGRAIAERPGRPGAAGCGR